MNSLLAARSQPFRAWHSWFTPAQIDQRTSPHNGTIKVYKFYRRIWFEVDGLQQSGASIDYVWAKAFAHFFTPPTAWQPDTVLVLGLAGASVVTQLQRSWPSCRITGVDHDPIMVKLGRQYFPSQVNACQIETADVFAFIKDQQPFDLIIVDLFKGHQIPQKLASGSFLNNLHGSLTPQGKCLFNLYYHPDNDPIIDQLLAHLSRTSINSQTYRVIDNLLVLTSNSPIPSQDHD